MLGQPEPDSEMKQQAQLIENKTDIPAVSQQKPPAKDSSLATFSLSLFHHNFHWGNDVIYGFVKPRAVYIAEVSNENTSLLAEEPTAEFYNRWIVPPTPEEAAVDMPDKVVEYQRFLQRHPIAKYQKLALREIVPVGERKREITRSCKAKMQEIALRGGVVHFVLDDPEHPWDMEAVVKKEGVPGQLITVKELRFLYKNREKLVAHFQFWKKGQKVQAPWDENPGLWSKFRSGKS